VTLLIPVHTGSSSLTYNLPSAEGFF